MIQHLLQRLVFGIVLISFTTQLQAQRYRQIPIRPVKTLAPLSFHVVRVIDNREIRSSIGQAKSGIARIPVNLKFKGDIEDRIKTCYNGLLKNSSKVEPIIIAINKIEINEYRREKEKPWLINVSFEFLKEEGDMLYSYGIVSLNRSMKIAGVEKINTRLNDIFIEMLVEYQKLKNSANETPVFIATEEIKLDNINNNLSFPKVAIHRVNN